MKTQITLPTDTALTLKEYIVASMPARTDSVSPIEILLWITLRRVAKKIHNRLFDSPKTLTIGLSVREELALYTLLTQGDVDPSLVTNTNLLHFLQQLDRKLKDNIFLIEPLFNG